LVSLLALSLATPVLAQQATSSPPTTSTQPMIGCAYPLPGLRVGQQGDDVKALQEILGSDETIYPQKLNTGYFGSLTENALKKLQHKYNLPETGVLDEGTANIIFPCVQLRVVSPNGGEQWQAGQTYQVTWTFVSPLPLPSATSSQSTSSPLIAPSPSYFPRLSVDLIKGSKLVSRIGTASIYNESSLSWTISQSAQSGSDYKVRISSISPVMIQTEAVPQIYPPVWRGRVFDESDNPFTITGGTSGTVPLEQLQKISSQLENLAQQLNSIIKQLRDIIEGIAH